MRTSALQARLRSGVVRAAATPDYIVDAGAITFTSETHLHVNGEEFRLQPVPPAHTDGDVIVRLEKANVVHMGDLYFEGMFPFIDASSGGWIGGMVEGVKTGLTLVDDKTKVIPGHGPLSDKAGLRAFADALRGTTGAVAKALAAGKTLDQMKAENILAQWDTWGKGFIKTDAWLTLLVSEAKKP